MLPKVPYEVRVSRCEDRVPNRFCSLRPILDRVCIGLGDVGPVDWGSVLCRKRHGWLKISLPGPATRSGVHIKPECSHLSPVSPTLMIFDCLSFDGPCDRVMDIVHIERVCSCIELRNRFRNFLRHFHKTTLIQPLLWLCPDSEATNGQRKTGCQNG